MTRETKIGLLVAGSFLCLVGIVVASKWNHGEAGPESEEQTVTPGAVLHPTAQSGDVKPKGKDDNRPVAVAAAEKSKLGVAKKPNALPEFKLPPPVTPTEEKAIEQDSERKRNELLALVKNEQKAPEVPLPTPAGAAVLPAFPGPGSGDLKPLPVPMPGGDLKPLPLPIPGPGRDLKSLPVPTPGVGADLKPLPMPGGELKPLPVPTPLGSGDLKPLPFPSPGSDLKPLPVPMPGNAGDLKPLPMPGNDLKPLPAPSPLPVPVPPGSGDLKPLPVPGPIPAPPGPVRNVELQPIKPFNDPTPIPAPKPGPLDSTVPPLGGTTLSPPAPFSEGVKPMVPPPGPIPVIPPTGGAVLPAVPPITVGGARPLPGVKEVNVDIYEAQKGDSTFAILSLRMYGTDKYADALLQYNREHSALIKNGAWLSVNPPALNTGQQVLKPPQSVLERDYRTLVRPEAVPQVRIGGAPSPLGSGPIAAVSNPPVASGARTYTVQGATGESILDVAERVLGDRSQWHRIYQANPSLVPENRIPAGTTLKVP